MEVITKQLINDVDQVVDDSIFGFVATHSNVTILSTCPRVVIRRDWQTTRIPNEIAIVSGGGAGHEPFANGLVGKGMLTAAVTGNIFASPPTVHISAALDAVANADGILVIINNYTGDRLNFGLSVERFNHQYAGCARIVLVGDDTALQSDDLSAGRRGLVGSTFVIKIAGALANALKYKLDEIVTIVEKVAANVGTISISLSGCSIPGRAPMFQLQSNEYVLGLGIHGEPGVKRLPMADARQIVDTMLDHLSSRSATPLSLNKGDRIAIFINNMGSMTQMEMNIIAGETVRWLNNRGLQIERLYASSMTTSLDMHGVSISILKLICDGWIHYLDMPVEASAWSWTSQSASGPFALTERTVLASPGFANLCSIETDTKQVSTATATRIERCLRAICDVLVERVDELNELDRFAGDGDCGDTLRNAARAIKASILDGSLSCICPYSLLQRLSFIVEQSAGGTSGALYAIMLSAAATYIRKSNTTLPIDYYNALKAGLDAVMRHGRSMPGHRTMIDPIHAAIASIDTNIPIDQTAFDNAVKAAEESAVSTASMIAKAGRASYTAVDNQTMPDAGAMAVAYWMRAVYLAWYG